MKVMMLRFIMHRLGVAVIAVMPMRGIQRGEFIIFDLLCFHYFDFYVLNWRCPFLSSFADSAISMEVKMVKGHHLARPLPRLNQLYWGVFMHALIGLLMLSNLESREVIAELIHCS